jgi:putative glutamine amidotransferase
MTFPLIGITTYRQLNNFGYPVNALNEAYIQAISQAGGIPVLIPLGLPQSQLKEMRHHLDGILFSGGGDIEPARFGGDSHPAVDGIDPDRDRTEIQLVGYSVEGNIPFLGICRGIQTINIALGGTLYTHIPDQHPGAIHHPYIEGNPRDYLAHPVEIQPETQLFEIIGQSSVQVNSMHHQGIRDIAPGLKETAHAPDGLIEAVELPGHPFGIAVQWHPECLTHLAPMRELFQAFVKAASQRRK